MLGNLYEANRELFHVSRENCLHPDVLELRWRISAKLKRWDFAYTVGIAMVKTVPSWAPGWVYCAYAARRKPSGGVALAWKELLPAGQFFPQEPAILYNLACYALLLGRSKESWRWLERAVTADPDGDLSDRALHEPMFRDFWPRLRQCLAKLEALKPA
jgi:hypothetical protein